MPSWIGPWEIAIVLVLALLIFGPKKLPDLGSSLGRSITGFKKGLKETKDDVQSAIKEDVTVSGAEATTQARAEATVATAAAAAEPVAAPVVTATAVAAPATTATVTPAVTPTEGAPV
jgi:sec-independent protein translocase protein TatA